MAAVTVKLASKSFDAAMKVPNRLLAIEAQGDWGQGYPARQQALRSSSVVLTVAAWQAFVAEIAEAVLTGTTKKAGRKAKALAAVADAALADALTRFNTPNMANTGTLFAGVGLSLGTGWTVTLGNATLNADQASSLINAWLQVRHSIVHGVPFHENAKLSKLRFQGHIKSRVVTGKRAGKGKGIALAGGDADGCRDLFLAMKQTVVARATAHLASL